MSRTLGQVAVGETVTISEDGQQIEYIVISHNYEMSYNGTGKTLLLRNPQFSYGSIWGQNGYYYDNSGLNAYLNSNFINRFQDDLIHKIQDTTIKISKNGNIATYTCKLFLLSVCELGREDLLYYEYTQYSDGNYIGDSILNIVKQTTTMNWWTRSHDINGNGVYYMWNGGNSKDIAVTNKMITNISLRPCFMLPDDVYIGDDGTVVPWFPPSTPTFISIPLYIKGGDTINITWGPSTDSDGAISSYAVERKINSSNEWLQIFRGNALSTTNLVEKGVTSVQYRVRAFDNRGLDSPYAISSIIQVENNTAPTTSANITVPESIQAGTQLQVSWDASADVDGNLSGYTLQRKTNTSEYAQIYQGQYTTFTDTAPSDGSTSIIYRVQAYDSEGLTSDWKESAAVTILYPPDVPELTLQKIIIKNSSFLISWNNVDENATYILERKTSTDQNFVQIYQGSDLMFEDTIGTQVSVQYRIKAVLSGVSSEYNTSDIRYPSNPLRINIPKGFSAGSIINAMWSAATETTGYMLERKVDNGEYASVYSGPATTFDDTAGKWTSVQYRVKFVYDNESSPWYESDVISAREISIQRMYRKNSDGSYTIIYPETAGSAVVDENGNNLENLVNTGSKIKFNTLLEYNKEGG